MSSHDDDPLDHDNSSTVPLEAQSVDRWLDADGQRWSRHVPSHDVLDERARAHRYAGRRAYPTYTDIAGEPQRPAVEANRSHERGSTSTTAPAAVDACWHDCSGGQRLSLRGSAPWPGRW